jgi:hypothetical protein
MNMAGEWISSQLESSYGGNIDSVLIELCCTNVSPPRKTLEELNERFEKYLGELPNYEIQEKGTELKIAYRAVKYYHDEVNRDSQVIALKLFGVLLRKAATLIEPANEKVKALQGFDSKKLSEDIAKALPNMPKTLLGMVKLYEAQKKEKPNN